MPYKMVGERDGRLKMFKGRIWGSGWNLLHQDLFDGRDCDCGSSCDWLLSLLLLAPLVLDCCCCCCW